MASNREQFTTEIYVNQEQANDALGKLRDKVNETAKAYEKLLNTKDADSAKTEKARKAWEQAKASLANVEKGVDEYRKAMDNLTGKSMDSLLRMQRQINSELKKTKPNTEEWKRLSKQYGQVTDRIRDLKKAQSEMMSGMGKLRQMAGNVTSWFNKFGLAIMAIPTAIKGVTSALSGVISVTKQVINASQSMGDKWNNGMAAMKTTTDAFFMALSSGDWSAFNDGIAAALKNARDLAETMDLLGSYAISADYMRSEYLTSFQEHLNNARDTGLTKEERQAELEAAKADMEAYNQTITEMADVTRESLIKEFKAVKGIDYTDDLEGFDAFFDELYKKVIVGGNNMVAEAKKKLQDLTAEIQNEGHWEYYASEKGMERYWVGVDKATASMRALKAVTEEYGEDVVNLARASELSDDELKSLLERYKQAKSSEKEVLTIERQLTRTRNQLYGNTKPVDAYTEAVKKVDKAEAAQLNTLKQLYATGLMDKATYEAQKAMVEEDYLKQRMATAEKYGKDTDQFMSQLLDRQIARMEKAKAMLKEEADEMAKYYKETLTDQNMSDEDYGKLQKQQRRQGYKEKLGTIPGETDEEFDARIDQYEAFQEKLWAKAADIRAAITEDSARTQYETEMAWAEKLANDGKITAEEAEKYKLKIKLEYAQKAAEQINSITEQASNFVNSLKEYETQKAEAEYQAQLTAAGDNAEEREAIEAAYEQKKLDIQKKYADTEMVINIAKTIAAGALAAIQAFAQLGPVGGAIAAVLIAATTALEVATIVQQRTAIKNASVSGGGSGSASSAKTGTRTITGYSEGGNTKRAASDSTVVGVVHANEWVAPAWMVRKNPTVFADLEQYRRTLGRGRMKLAKPGFADGGFTNKGETATNKPTITDIDIERAVYKGFRAALENEWFRAYVVRKDIKDMDEQDARFKKQTSR